MEEQTRPPPHGRNARPVGGPWPGWQPDSDLAPQQQWPEHRYPGRRGPGWWRRGPRRSGPLRRRPDDRLAGGVAAGLAARTGIDVTAVRIAFVLTGLGGVGVAAYVLAWLLIPAVGSDSTIASKAMTDRRGITLAAGPARSSP